VFAEKTQKEQKKKIKDFLICDSSAFLILHSGEIKKCAYKFHKTLQKHEECLLENLALL